MASCEVRRPGVIRLAAALSSHSQAQDMFCRRFCVQSCRENDSASGEVSTRLYPQPCNAHHCVRMHAWDDAMYGFRRTLPDFASWCERSTPLLADASFCSLGLVKTMFPDAHSALASARESTKCYQLSSFPIILTSHQPASFYCPDETPRQ